MSRKKLAMIFPYAPSYRDAIYRLMDAKWDIDWYFAGNCDPKLKLLNYTTLRNVNLSLNYKKFGPFTILKGITKIEIEKYDAIIIPGVFRCISDLLMMLRHSTKSKVKLYLWTHGWYGKESTFEKVIKKFFYPRVNGIFLYGDRAKRLMIEEGFDPKMLHVIHNSLDYGKQLQLRKNISISDIYNNYFKNSNKTLIFIGRLTKVKKLDLLIGALDILKKKNELYNLVFIGDGEERNKLEQIVEEHNLGSQVWFYGKCFDEEKNAELIYNADLCISPGNVGLTAIHSLMFGCPVITNDDFNTQMPEYEVIKPKKTGDFFKVDDVNSLAYSISEWFTKNNLDKKTVRVHCFQTIDRNWNPNFQMELLDHIINEDGNFIE